MVGTEGGKLEHLNLTDCCTRKVYSAHEESDAGISTIVEIKSKSSLLRGPNDDKNFRLIATASLGSSQFKLWRLNNQTKELLPYLTIKTTFTDGIRFLLETQENQLVAANNNNIKFYDFIDSKEREAKEAKEKKMEEHQKMMKDLFLDLDKEKTLKLHKADVKKYL